MGIRIDPAALDRQLTISGCDNRRELPYHKALLAGELPLSVGDWVKVPFGMENVVKRGKVTSVTRCTRRTAPWPPEETKTVLCMTEQPTEFEMQ